MKSLAEHLGDLGVQPTRILAMTTVLLVHAGFALILLAPITSNEATRDRRSGSEDGIRVTFIARTSPKTSVAPPPPPEKHRVEMKRAEPAQEPAIVPVAQAPVPVEELAHAELPPEMAQSYDDGRLPFMTTDPVEVKEAGDAPQIYGQTDELPSEFTQAVDVLPMEMAEYRKVSQPVYLSEARDAGEQGIVIVRVLVDEHGYPVGLKVMRTTAGQRLTVETLRAISTWQFKPALRDGVAVKGTLLVPIYFFLDGMPPSLKQWRAMGGAERAGAQ